MDDEIYFNPNNGINEMSEFTCSICNKTYPKDNNDEWNDFKAAEEMLDIMPEAKNDPTDIVCDPCYKSFRKWFDKLSDEEKINMRNQK